MQTEQQGRWLRRKQAAKYCQIAKSTLEKMAVFGDGPPFSKIGRTVLYDISKLDEWLESKTISSTSIKT